MFGQSMAARGDGVQLRQLVQADRGSNIGQVEFAAQHIHVHAVEAGARDALQAIFFREACFVFVVQHQAAAFGRGEVLVGLKTERDEIAEDCRYACLSTSEPMACAASSTTRSL